MSQFNAFENAIDFSFWREMCEDHGTRVRFGRGEYFVHAGSVLQRVGWILSGGFKHSLIDDTGNVKAVGFVFGGSVLANYLSAMLYKPMPTDIIAIEDSEALVIPAEIVRNRLMNDPTLNIAFVQALFEQAYNQILGTYRSSPTERYLELIKRYPRITQLTSLAEIASYLNISYRQLHRIRDSVAKGEI
ncbi:MAG: Crp/Fnr family transcriptional regulator [Muribaculaceae bacterium]|nr:Crp/Fnr family transcriptional regulator [Muribaculaceae bacterium]